MKGPYALTIFTAPKPFRGDIDRIQRNAIGSWAALGPDIQIVLLGDEDGIGQAAWELGVGHIAQVDRNQLGTPRVDSVFALASAAAAGPILCYVNTDIILLDDFLPAVKTISERFDQYLMVGQRWDLQIGEALDFSQPGVERLRERVRNQGVLHPPAGSDYFVFPSQSFPSIPPFALGRAGWDNWMIFSARSSGIPVVDASRAVTAIHQNHDYAHLPRGLPHHRLPESAHNTELAGGREAIFALADATWRIENGAVTRQLIGRQGIRRTLEAAIYSRLGAGRISRLVRLAFHPIDTWRYFWARSRPDGPVDGRTAGSG